MHSTSGLVGRLRAVMAIEPERGAVEFGGRWRSWGQLAHVMARVDALLSSAGQGKSTAVGMLLRNRPVHLAAALGVLCTQRCVLTINPFQAPAKLAAHIGQLKVAALIVDAQDWAQPELRAAVTATGAMVIVLEEGVDTMAVNPVPGREQPGAGPHHEPLPGIGILMLSSGTTGAPKRIPLALASFEKALLGAVSYYEAAGEGSGLSLKRSVAFATMPLVHIGGLWISVLNLLSGRAIVLFEKFGVEEFRRAMREHRPKLVSLPPTALRMIYDADLPREDLASLMALRSGSAPLDPDFADKFHERYGVPILDAYGATEFAGGVAGWTWPDWQQFGQHKRGSVGKANQGVQLRIVDEAGGAELPPGTIGLLEVRARQLGHDEWVRTTDLAELDEDGFLYIRGRSDDAIIRGGFKVLPADVVAQLKRHPAVFDACVVGLSDERLGAVPVAAVELRPGMPAPTEEELIAMLRAELVAYQIPVRIAVLDALPRTPSMKVSQPDVKALLAKPAVQGVAHATA